MREQFARTEILLGSEGMQRLAAARVAVFGVGGVGGYAVEALARSGVGTIDIFDDDVVAVSNLNRQIIAVHDTIGMPKVEVMKARALSINPDAVIHAHRCFYMPDNADEFDLSEYTYIIDAVDTVTAKIEIIMRADAAGVPVISCMGTGNKLDASRLEVTDIYKTTMCPLARVMRRELKKRGIRKLRVVYSAEAPLSALSQPAEDTPKSAARGGKPKKVIPGSTAFVPAAAGLIAAGEAVKWIVNC